MTDKEFEAFLTKSQVKVKEKQAKLNELYGLNTYESYSFSQKARSLTLKKQTGEQLVCEVICIGSWGYEDESWVWAWHNENLSLEIREEAKGLKDLVKKTGFGVFEEGSFKCEEIVARDLAFVSVCELKAKGIYRISVDESYLFLAIKNIK